MPSSREPLTRRVALTSADAIGLRLQAGTLLLVGTHLTEVEADTACTRLRDLLTGHPGKVAVVTVGHGTP